MQAHHSSPFISSNIKKMVWNHGATPEPIHEPIMINSLSFSTSVLTNSALTSPSLYTVGITEALNPKSRTVEEPLLIMAASPQFISSEPVSQSRQRVVRGTHMYGFQFLVLQATSMSEEELALLYNLCRLDNLPCTSFVGSS